MTERLNREEYERIRRHRRRLEMRRRRRQRKRRIEAFFHLLLFLLSLTAIFLIFTRHYKERGQLNIMVLHKQSQKKLVALGKSVSASMKLLASPAVSPEENSAQKPDASFRIGSVGDVMLHLPLIQAYGGLDSTQHDFTPALKTFQAAYESVDYMVVNLEASLAGDSKPYSGFPAFNVPDEIVANLRDVGVDLQLLANNHIYDNGKTGFLRTISVLQNNQVSYTGARASLDEPRYLIQDINGIRIGIINYTFETEREDDRKSINSNVMDRSVEDLLNSFEVSDIEPFYLEIGQIQRELYAQGVEFTICYMHWGNEYELNSNDTQKAIAARLCEMGIDAVIGSHPHVVQPVDVFSSQDGTHKMLCAYSLGNHLSNQRRERISSRPNGHTEDGLMLNLTIARVAGRVSITDIEAIPTYVYKTNAPLFYVIPIYEPSNVEQQTGLKGIQPAIQASYDRTKNILGNTVEDAKRELGIPLE